jgi:hypothetical protein
MMKEYLSNLKETIADSVQDFIVTAIIKAAVTKLVSMFNPVGAIIQAILAIYNVVMFFVEKINQILAFVQSIIDSVYAIVMHQIDNAANAIEQALARTIPLIIGFLARLLGLSGITQKIVGIIKKIQDKVDKAVDKVIAKVVAGIGKLFGGKKSGDPEKDAKVTAALKAIDDEDERCVKAGKVTREDIEQVAVKIKKEHPVLKSLVVVDGKNRWDYKYAASPEATKEGPNKTGEEWPTGDASDPIPIKWFKQEAFYPAIRLNGVEYRPTTGITLPAISPKSSRRIDVVNANFLQVGADTGRQERPTPTASDTFGKHLRELGQLPASDNRRIEVVGTGTDYQIDHVRDLVWQGGDNDHNLWPLRTALNKGANASHYQQVRVKVGDEVKTGAVSSFPKAFHYRIKAIASTAPTSSGDHGTDKDNPTNNGKGIPKRIS